MNFIEFITFIYPIIKGVIMAIMWFIACCCVIVFPLAGWVYVWLHNKFVVRLLVIAPLLFIVLWGITNCLIYITKIVVGM
jgi:hypothetical protein